LPRSFLPTPFAKQRSSAKRRPFQLESSHICTLPDVGLAGGVDYLVMECVEGETLAKRLEKRAAALEQVLKFGAQIATRWIKRIGAAWCIGSKARNIMLTAWTKLLDFGLAKLPHPW